MRTSQVSLFIFTLLLTQALAAKTYIVRFESHEKLVRAQRASQQALRSSSGQKSHSFLRAAPVSAAEFLEHVDLAVIETNDPAVVEQLKKNPLIADIEEDEWIPLPEVGLFEAAEDFLPRAVSQELTWGLYAVHAPEAWQMTRGEGVRALVIDSGVDVSHPDLIGRYEKGRGFLSDNSIKDEIGHGTHVAGTVLADGAGTGLLGVAPAARLLVAKVCNSGCSTAATARAINWGIQEKVHVMNLSLGGPRPSQQQAYRRAEQAGIIVVAAAGNNGTGSLSYPAGYSTVLSVGAIAEDMSWASFSQYSSSLDIVAPGVDVYSSIPVGTGRAAMVMVDGAEVKSRHVPRSKPPLDLRTAELVHVGLGRSQDYRGLNLRGKIALIQRGQITFEEKTQRALRAGAIGILIYNNVPGLINAALDQDINVPVAMIEQDVGEAITEQLKSTPSEVIMGLQATDHSSIQGTSMATPHVAGVAALVRSVNKSMTAAQVRQLLRDTAEKFTVNPQNKFGRGLVNAEEAVRKAMAP